MSLLDFIFETAFNGKSFTPEVDVSENYKNWISENDWKRCIEYANLHGKIWHIAEKPEPEPPLHPHCRCIIDFMESVKAGTATINETDGADWTLKHEGKLPEYYIEEDEIRTLGWRPGRWPSNFAPGKMIKKGIYSNRNNHLPDEIGRVWYEADINYMQGKRNSQRVVWSNDGLIFVSYDHYKTFHEII